jgi:hypothetical protein
MPQQGLIEADERGRERWKNYGRTEFGLKISNSGAMRSLLPKDYLTRFKEGWRPVCRERIVRWKEGSAFCRSYVLCGEGGALDLSGVT